MIDPTFEDSNDLSSMLHNLPDQEVDEENTYTTEWDAAPTYAQEDNVVSSPAEDTEDTELPAATPDPGSDTDTVIEEFEEDESTTVEYTPAVHTSEEPKVVYTSTDNVTDANTTVTGEPPVEDAVSQPNEYASEDVVLQDDDPWANYVEDGVFGNSYAWQNDWFWQGETMYCGPTSAAFIMNQFYGANISDPAFLASEAVRLGIDDTLEDGTTMPQLHDLMEAYGISVEIEAANPDNPMFDLAKYLEEGRGVIAMVDSNEIWNITNPERGYVDGALDDPNHFLIVSEINANTGIVTLTDPGHPDGNGIQVSIDEFEDAWHDSGHHMLVTNGTNDELCDPSLQHTGGNFVIVNATGSEKF